MQRIPLPSRHSSPAAAELTPTGLPLRHWLCLLSVVALAGLALPASGALPPDWSEADVGGPVAAGSASYSAGTFTVSGAGTDIGGTSDHFHFAYNLLVTNYAVIRARVDSLQNTDDGAKAGVMFRDTTSGSSAYAMACVTYANGVNFQALSSSGATTVSSIVGGIAAPVWLQLVRVGNEFTGSYSLDGSAWTEDVLIKLDEEMKEFKKALKGKQQ